jgi:tetratricopeptide (TPR) repeat protein
MDLRSNIMYTLQLAPCPIVAPLLAAQSLDDLLPDQRELVGRHLSQCEACQNTRREYEALQAMLNLVALQAPEELTDLLSRSALSGLYAKITASPPPALPPALQQLWADEDRRNSTSSGIMLTGITNEPSPERLRISEKRPETASPHQEGLGTSHMTVTFVSSLRWPDARTETAEPSHSPEVASRLARAYACLKSNRTVEALAVIEPLLAVSMSARQLMRVWYVMGHAYAAHSVYDKALAFLDEAVAQASQLQDLGAMAELAYLRGSIYGAIQEFGLAVGDLRMSLESLHALMPDADSADPDFELGVLVLLASFAFVTACYDEAAQYISHARKLIRLTPGATLQAASIEWVEALLYRWSGQPDLALRNALQAAECFLQPHGDVEPLSRARIFSVVADCALDVAESLPQQPHFARDRLIDLARPYAIFAVRSARSALSPQSTESEAVQGLTLLTRARFDRLAHYEHNHSTMIESVVRTATHIGDKPLLAQAYTALGHEFAAHGDTGPALNCYRQALGVQGIEDAAALAVWARRGLLHAAEMAE